MKVIELVDASIAVGTPQTFSINLEYLDPDGFFTAEITTTGAGSLKVECLGSVSSIVANMVVPDGMSDVVAAHTVGTGIYGIEPGMALAQMSLKLTASGATVPTKLYLLVD